MITPEIATAMALACVALVAYLIATHFSMKLNDVAKAHDADLETEANREPDYPPHVIENLHKLAKIMRGLQ